MREQTADKKVHAADATSTSAPTKAGTPGSNQRRIPHLRVALAVAAALAAILVAVGSGENDDVATLVLAAEPFSSTLRARGHLDAASTATVGADAPGRVDAVLVKVGDSVSAGEALIRLDALVAKEQFRAAAATASSAEDGVRSARADLAGAEVQLAERRADHERIAPLAGTAVPAADVASARLSVAKAESEVERAKARLAQAESQATGAAADREAARQLLNDLVIRAPISGVVVSRDAHPGDAIGGGTPLLRLADPGTLEIVAYLDETVLSGLRVGLPARVAFLSEVGQSVNGTVASVGREVDPETREIELRIALVQTPRRWALGQRADVQVSSDSGAASLTVPTSLVSWRGPEAGLYIVQGGRSRWVPVTLGLADGDRIEVASGVSVGDTLLAPDGYRAGEPATPVVGMAREVR